MGYVVNKRTLEERRSVHTPDYSATDWIINPDMGPISGVQKKYWKVDGNSLVEMSASEKEAVDAAELEAKKATKISALWDAAWQTQFNAISGAALTMLDRLVRNGSANAIADEAWINRVWGDYYTRKATVQAATSISGVQAVSTDFSNHGPLPHTVQELLQEALSLGILN